MSKLKTDANATRTHGMSMYGKITFYMIIICLGFLMTGCDVFPVADKGFDIYATSERDVQTYTSYDKPVVEPHVINYLVPNTLVEMTNEINPVTNHSVSYPIFSGLKSKDVEAKINGQIQALVQEVEKLLGPETIAPFRGINTFVREGISLSDSYVSLYTSFNANNILSMRCYASGTYQPRGASEFDARWMTLNRGLNLDVNTGEKVPLEALFIDGFDYERVINEAIVAQIEQNNLMDETYLEYTYLPTRLTKPFDGIAHDQDFCLDAFNLTIIIDENDPRFDTAFEQVTFTIPLEKFGDHLAIDSRYFDPENTLFIDATQKRMLPTWNSAGRGLSHYYEGAFDGGKWYMTAYDENDQLEDVYSALIEVSKAYLDGLKMEGADNHAEMTLLKMSVGKYVTIFKSLWLTQGSHSMSEMDYQMYDPSGKKLILDDLFVKGFDFEAIIKDYVRNQLLQSEQFSQDAFESAYAEKQFSLDPSHLMINLPVTNQNMETYLQQIYIPFDVLGVQNMTIFD